MIDPKLIAIYFPQFHSIPENDKWWGKGFNDWNLVENAKPLFQGHNQPKVPLDGMYNPCDKETLKHQADLARKYGIHGFMFYHYWFDGKLLLEKPMETLRDNTDIDINYCVCWANGTWTRAWEGESEILIEQKHTNDPEIWKAHFNYLLPFFKDKRAIRKDGKPVFLVYQPNLLNNTKEMFDLWSQLAVEHGLPGLYTIAIKNYDFGNHTSFLKYYDGMMKFQPREAFTSKYFKGNSTNKFQFLRRLPPFLWKIIQNIYLKFKSYTMVNGDEIWSIILHQAYVAQYPQYDLDIYECGFIEWDNTSRYKNKAKIFSRPNRSNLERYISELYSKAVKHNSEFIFWNAWNEWSESAYLEPDKMRGYENLELIHNINTPPHHPDNFLLYSNL
ncbi:glycoside hydrolase family 99-like domain-containing protein [Parabacteroides sp. ZJ-118]|uniref:glycosyltransferase WbsX family protein n=1 Tax=Parabacteroides sp. ZJ-118 TaxID=2709398 RepID=UPI0013EAB157|nr:glycoside hydrolase family 99-like domain-containing protein [Parabacteroides sp. ZJ-118]